MPKTRANSPHIDDLGLLQHLLTVPPSAQSSARRPKQLRSLHEQRSQTLRGYRFRSIVDHILPPVERLLMILIIGFFGYWLFDGYVRDWWHARENPVVSPVAWDAVRPGASAAELDAALGPALPYLPESGVLPARPPDYLVPAQAFVAVDAPTPEPGDLRPLRLVVPVMQLDTPVKEVFLQNGVWEVADYAVGYHHSTALPGTGNTVLAGHAGFRGGVFAQLGAMVIGADVYLDTQATRFHYRVIEMYNVLPDQVEVMYPTDQAQITMITCTAWDTQRLIVVAELVDQAPLSPKVGGGDSREQS